MARFAAGAWEWGETPGRVPTPFAKAWQGTLGHAGHARKTNLEGFARALEKRLKINMEPSKLVLCRCFSFSKGVCSGSMLVFRGVNEFSGTEIRVPELLRKNIVIFLGSSAADSKSKNCISPCMGGGFKYVLFSPLLGEMIQFDYIIFLRWAVQPPTRCCFRGIFVVQSLPDPLPRSMFSYLLDPGTIAKARILHEKTQNFPQNKMPLENWLGEDVEIVSRKILRYLFC